MTFQYPALLFVGLTAVERKLGLRTFCTVFGTALTAGSYTGGIQRTTYGVITHTWQVINTAAADQDHAVLLQVMTFTTDVGGHFITAGQAHTANFAQSRVRLLRSGGIHAGAHATTLRAALQGRHVALFTSASARLTNQL